MGQQTAPSNDPSVLSKLGLRLGDYLPWRGQYFGLPPPPTGNEVSSVASNWAVELGSTSRSIGIVISGNCFIASPDQANTSNPRWPDNTKPIAAIVSLPQTNIEISGNMCSGTFSGKDYADYSGYWFGFNNSFRGFGFNL